jgi:membrane-associated protease RseP (regulator of RpoE activity)
LIIPGVAIPGSPIFIPFEFGIIALMTVMVVHEFGHGIISRVEGVRIDSIGVLLLAILPGAFVEPNEEDIEKSKRISKLRIYAAGSFFNLLLAAVSIIIVSAITILTLGGLSFAIPGVSVPYTDITTQPIELLNVSGPIYQVFNSDGNQIISVVPSSPANGILQQGMVIQSINGHSTTNSTNYLAAVNNTKIGENLTIKTNQGTYHITAGSNPNNSTRGYIGISTELHEVVNANVAKKYGAQLPWLTYFISQLFYWIFLLNFAVGTFNLLPMKPLDGGLMFEEILRYKLSEKWVNRIVTPVSYILILIIVVSIVYSLGRGLLLLL